MTNLSFAVNINYMNMLKLQKEFVAFIKIIIVFEA
jgi:hypothetical protein